MNLDQHIKRIYILWALCFFIGAFALTKINFQSESHDSQYYTGQVIFYQDRPINELLAPKWNDGSYGFDPNSYMRDQFPTHIIMGVMVSKIGVPAKDALHILEMLFQILSIIVLFKIAQTLNPKAENTFLMIGLLFFPFAFSYNVRANHESGIALFSFLALYSGLKFNQNFKYIALSFISSIFLLIVKGPFIVFGPLLTLLGIILNNQLNKKIIIKYLILQILVLVFSIGVLYWYELKFISLTGESFFDSFVNIQFKNRALDLKVEHHFIIQKILNFWYYFNHSIIYSLPWLLLGLIAIIKNWKIDKWKTLVPNKSAIAFLGGSLVFCSVFSLSNRIAGRYTHPSYYFFTAYILIIILENLPKFSDFYRNKILQISQYIIPILWSFALVLHFIY